MRKCRELKYWETDKKELDNWFVEVASPTKILKKLGMARSTVLKYKNLIKNKGKSLQDLVTIAVYRNLIDMHNEEHIQQVEKAKKIKEKKLLAKKQRDNNVKQLKQQLEKYGFDVTPKKDQSKPLSEQEIQEIKKPKVEAESNKSELISLDEFKKLSYEEMKQYVNAHKSSLTGKTAFTYLKVMQNAKGQKHE